MDITKRQLELWREYKIELVDAKAGELSVRNQICEELFGERRGKFTVNEELHGFKVKANSTVNVSWDDKPEILARALTGKLTDAEKAAVKVSVSVNMAGLLDLEELEPDSELLDMVTETQATPTLSVEVILED